MKNSIILPSLFSSILLLALWCLLLSHSAVAYNSQSIVSKSNPGDRVGQKMEDQVPEAIIPESPVLKAGEALLAFETPEHIGVTLLAHEPLVFNPIAAIYDEKGRLWVAEMTSYMPNILAEDEERPNNQIIVLSDSDQDGIFDKRTVLLDKLILPRALAFAPHGLLWADNTTLYYSEIDNSKDEPIVVYTDVVDNQYAAKGNVEHKPNGLLYSLDNWYYSAKSTNRYRAYPLHQKPPIEGTEVYRNKHFALIKAPTEFRGQWGISQDDYGRHYFNTNSSPVQTSSYLPSMSHRNPDYQFPASYLIEEIGNNHVFPIRVTPGINRGYNANMYSNDYKLKRHTSASGPLFYRGSQFPKSFYGMVVVSESAGNLVKATRTFEIDGKVKGEDMFDRQSLLASTDERFRPIAALNAPDGTITLLDMYHGIVQHRTYMTSYLRKQIEMRNLDNNPNTGRIYRIYHKQSPVTKPVLLNGLSPTQLVNYLSHENAWHRDLAQQLLVMSQSHESISSLKALVHSSNNSISITKALWTLEGLGVIELDLLKIAQKVRNNKLSNTVYRLAEQLNTTQALTQWLESEMGYINPETINAFTLLVGSHRQWTLMTKLINLYGISPTTYAAFGHSASEYFSSEYKNIHSESTSRLLAETLQQLSKPKAANTLDENAFASFTRGNKLYLGKAGCFGCHGESGEGNNLIPPLNKSDWVLASERKLVAILLHGFSGPMQVRGKLYDSGMTMPGLSANPSISDQDIADIATYIRNAWENEAPEISTETVQQIRKLTIDQEKPYTNASIDVFLEESN